MRGVWDNAESCCMHKGGVLSVICIYICVGWGWGRRMWTWLCGCVDVWMCVFGGRAVSGTSSVAAVASSVGRIDALMLGLYQMMN